MDLTRLWKLHFERQGESMQRIILYQESSYVIVQHISETGTKYAPMTIRRQETKTQYELDLLLMRFKGEQLNELFGSYSASKPLYYQFAVNSHQRIKVTYTRTAPWYWKGSVDMRQLLG